MDAPTAPIAGQPKAAVLFIFATVLIDVTALDRAGDRAAG
jgi:hypothetical protein